MVSNYSRKKAKYTYAERVLGALTDIQKEHRKHAVHMATLRAHVRKMADARKDKMGPQWSQWVSRTVNRLADDGILDTSDPHGNVAFTPDAKKTITKVRRESMGPGVAFSPVVERKIWKDVTRRFSGVGVKRPRRRSSALHAPVLNDDEWDDEDTPPRKRRARNSLSRMTKAELESELRDALNRLQEAQELQPASAEEVTVLQEELSDREKEVASLREELSQLRDRPPQADDPRVTVGTSTAMLTPPPTNVSLPSSSSQTATGARSRLAVHAVTRTLSGSLISNLSKRPTPEPSDVGSQGTEIDELAFDNGMGEASISSAFPEVNEDAFSRPPVSHGLATPSSSPLLADEEDFGPEVGAQLDYAEEEEDESRNEVSRLTNELEYRSSALDSLREEYRNLLLESEGLKDSVTSRDDRIRSLEADLRERSKQLFNSESQRLELETTLTTETTRRRAAEDALRNSDSSLITEREKNALLGKQVSTLAEECNSLQGQISSLSDHSKGLADELKAMGSDCDTWREAHHESERKLQNAMTELVNVNEQLGASQHDCQVFKQALEQSETDLAERSAQLEKTNALLVGVRQELAQARQALEIGIASQATMSSRIAELERDLEGAHERTRVLDIAKTSLEHASGDLQKTLEQLRGELSHTKAQLDASRAEVQQAQDVIGDLRASHAQALSDASTAAEEAIAVKVSVSELALTADTLRAQLQDAEVEAAGLRRSMETVEAAGRVAESELVSVRASRDKLLSDLADKTARLSSSTEELIQVRREEEEVRRQLGALEVQHASELAVRAAERSAVEDALETARRAVTDLETQVDLLNARVSEMSVDLSSAVAEQERLSASLQEETDKFTALREELEVARSDVREAEEEIEELRQAKAEDEASIQSLKSGLAKLRQLQMDALNEVDSKHRRPGAGAEALWRRARVRRTVHDLPDDTTGNGGRPTPWMRQIYCIIRLLILADWACGRHLCVLIYALGCI
ncbi:hypothetical protein C8Q78DRAFT_960923 [Trametes maxima]|nr:hypothetical protein C8Q78DRAFT_960923 [Trametes maxima]